MRRARIAGSVTASGGANNDIRVIVAKGSRALFNSGMSRSIVLSVDCDEPGEYIIFLDNRSSLISSKTVSANIRIVEWGGIDVEKTEAAQAAKAERQQLANEVVTVLWNALKRAESQMGTQQLGSNQPRVALIADASPNAFAIWTKNTIAVSTGLFDLAERFGGTRDMIAGVIAHELSHIFYRHHTESAGGSLVDELIGRSRLDRTQEQQADILGSRLACQAGFDPNGLVNLIAELPNGPAFGNHPDGQTRVRYLMIEATRCGQSR
jgi:hypothetical protein